MALSDNEMLIELRESRRAQQHIIKAARTDSSNPEFFNRSVDDLVDKIDRYQAQLKTLRYRRENAGDIIEAGQKRIVDLTKRIKLLENQRAVKELLRLVSQMK